MSPSPEKPSSDELADQIFERAEALREALILAGHEIDRVLDNQLGGRR